MTYLVDKIQKLFIFAKIKGHRNPVYGRVKFIKVQAMAFHIGEGIALISKIENVFLRLLHLQFSTYCIHFSRYT